MTIYSLDYSFPNFELVHCSMSNSNCCFFTRTQVSQEPGKVVWYSHLFKNFKKKEKKNFSVCCDPTVKAFCIVNKGEVDVFLKFCCFLYDPMDVGHFISGSSAFSEPSFYIWKFSVHILLKPSLKSGYP